MKLLPGLPISTLKALDPKNNILKIDPIIVPFFGAFFISHTLRNFEKNRSL